MSPEHIIDEIEAMLKRGKVRTAIYLLDELRKAIDKPKWGKR